MTVHDFKGEMNLSSMSNIDDSPMIRYCICRFRYLTAFPVGESSIVPKQFTTAIHVVISC